MLKVYRQDKPIPTGTKVKTDYGNGNVRVEDLCQANLMYVGTAASFSEAKRLTPNPITSVE